MATTRKEINVTENGTLETTDDADQPDMLFDAGQAAMMIDYQRRNTVMRYAYEILAEIKRGSSYAPQLQAAYDQLMSAADTLYQAGNTLNVIAVSAGQSYKP